MISCQPFWASPRKSGESACTLIHRHHISSSTVDRLRKNKPLNTTTVNGLSRILDCGVSGIMEYVPPAQDQPL